MTSEARLSPTWSPHLQLHSNWYKRPIRLFFVKGMLGGGGPPAPYISVTLCYYLWSMGAGGGGPTALGALVSSEPVFLKG